MIDAPFLARWRSHLARVAGSAPLPAPVLANFERLAAGAKCVVTGQQAGVLTGPLLTILKAARAVSRARELERERGEPVVPVFWIAADDHDLDEIHHTFALNGQGELQKLRLELGAARGAAGEVEVPLAAGDALVDELWRVAAIDPAALDPAPFRPRGGDSLTTWFGRCLLQFFGDHGLVPFEPALFGELARPIYERALRSPAAIEQAMKEGAAALHSRGIVAPLPPRGDVVFRITVGARERIAAGAPTDLAEARATLPRLSADAALRPVLQTALLPCLAYVAGPTEAKYYEELRPLHALFGVPFPELVARPQATLFSVAASRALRKLGLTPSGLFAAIEKRGAGGGAVASAKSPLLERGAVLRAELVRYVDALLASSPAVKSAAERRATQLLQSFDGMVERVGAAQAEGDKVAGVRFAALEALARPRGKGQDRSLNVLPFFAERGAALIEQLITLRGEPDARGVVPHGIVSESGTENATNG